MRPVTTRLAPPLPVRRADAREARDTRLAQEVTVRRTADGGQIVVRRVTTQADGVPRTIHIDALVR